MIENLIVGGGLAGSALAIRLAEAGRQVVLIERETGPHDKVCGEFLSYEAVGYLRALGLDPEALGAVAVRDVRLFKGTRSVAAHLPFTALSLSRRILDEALLARAAGVGAEVRRGDRVTGIAQGPVWTVNTDGGDALQAQEVFLATGKHDVRGWKRPPGRQSDLVGFKMYFRLAKDQADRLDEAVELHLFAGGYAGLEPVEGGLANLCLVVRKSALKSYGNSWTGVLDRLQSDSPILGQRLHGGEAAGDKPLAISAIPYGYVRREGDGLWRLGDQGAVIPSFAGEGMSIALHSGELAAACRLSGAGADAFQRTLARQTGPQVGRATLVSQALVRPWSQAAAVMAASAWPGLMRTVAAGTRLPAQSLQHRDGGWAAA